MTIEGTPAQPDPLLPTELENESRLRQMLRAAEIDRPVLYGILSTLVRLLAGPITAILLTMYFTREMQGYYFTFFSLLALQVFGELGLGTVMIQFAAHEWAHLGRDERGRVQGDAHALARLRGLTTFSLRWYGAAGLLVMAGLGFGGGAFFGRTPSAGVIWQSPWLALCVLSGLRLWTTPLWALLEGCDQVAAVYRYRFVEGILTTASLWISIPSGAGLWAPVISLLTSHACNLGFLVLEHRRFLASVLRVPGKAPLRWWREVWPMQWRIAVSWISGYFSFSLFTPMAFKLSGPAEAGRMGLTWTVMQAIAAIAAAWLQTRAPRFGGLVARRDWKELDRVFVRVSAISIAVVVGLGGLFLGGVWMLELGHYRLADRVLPLLPTAVFLPAILLQQVGTCIGVYLRAHRQEPLMLPSIGLGACIAVSSWLLGRAFGSPGIAGAFLASQMLMSLWGIAIFLRCRRRWHQTWHGVAVR